MTRRMTITVVNTGISEKWELSQKWELREKNNSHLIHGKWMKGSPPKSIPENGKAVVESEKTTGSLYGTTGSIQFKSTIKKGSTLTITWNKPYDGTTTCIVDMNSIDYTAKVEHTNFKDAASCDVVIGVNNDPTVIDTKTWMGKLPAGTRLNEVMMPGSHDAGMSELLNCSVGANDSNTQTQQLDMQDQLEAGSRYFDLRVDYDHKKLFTYHRTGPFGCNGQLLETILDQMVEFLKTYKTETAILKFSQIRGDSNDTKTRIEKLLLSDKVKPYLYKGTNSNLAGLKVSDAAGKIIVVLDYDNTIHPDLGLFRYHDGFVKEVCNYRGLNMTVCDLYSDKSSYDKMSKDQITKWDNYAGLGKEYLFLLSWTLTAGIDDSIRDLAAIANGHLPAVLKEQIIDRKKGKPNIVYIDFVNTETARAIIAYNFK